MNAKDQIEKLFEDEDLPDLSAPQSQLPVIPLIPKKNYENTEPIDRRSFNRADITERKLELRFGSGSQFARQYIENISLGGVFVRTSEKREMSEILQIEFSIPIEDGTRTFNFRAKVCRVDPHGLGLEFIGMAQKTQDELEAFVKSVLPKNQPVIVRPKSVTITRLKKFRLKKIAEVAGKRTLIQRILCIGLLVGFNMYLVRESFEDQINVQAFKNNELNISGKKISLRNVRTISKTQNNEWVITLDDHSSYRVQPSQIEKQLPAYLQHTLALLRSTPPRPEIRRSKNTRELTNPRR